MRGEEEEICSVAMICNVYVDAINCDCEVLNVIVVFNGSVGQEVFE